MAGVRELDGYIQETEPFKVIKVDQDAGKVLITEMVERLATLATLLESFLPNSSSAEHLLGLVYTNKRFGQYRQTHEQAAHGRWQHGLEQRELEQCELEQRQLEQCELEQCQLEQRL